MDDGRGIMDDVKHASPIFILDLFPSIILIPFYILHIFANFTV